MTSGAGQGATAAPTGAGVQRRPGTGTGPAGWLSRSGRRGRGLRSGPGRPGRKRRSPPTLAGTLAALEAELGRAPAALLSVTGECLPLPEIASLAHRHGARVAVDGAQLVPHRRVDMRAIRADYLAFSGHKIYAPFGAGVLIGKRDWLDAAPPYLAGGGAVRHVTVESAWDHR